MAVILGLEVLGMLFGAIFWPVALIVWIVLYRLRRISRRILVCGLVLLIGLPALATYSMYRWMFLDEPLLSAAGEADTAQVRTLLARGADVNMPGENEMSSPLILAVRGNHADMVKLLLESGADVNRTDFDGNTALRFAEDAHQSDIVALLKKAGAKK